MAGLLFAGLCTAGAAPVTRLEFDSLDGTSLEVGCGGAAADWEMVRSLDDPTDGSMRSKDAAAATCLILPEAATSSGLITASVTAEEGSLGFVVRYSGPRDYLRLELNLSTGKTSAIQVAGGVERVIGGAQLPEIGALPHRLAATFDASSVELLLDGMRLLRLAAPASTPGRVGLFAEGRAVAEFDDVAFRPISDEAAPRLDPFAPGRAAVGSPVDVRLRCLNGDCEFGARPGSLPPGLSLATDGRITGRPRRPGVFRFDVAARLKETRVSARAQLELRVAAIAWPRFPPDPDSRSWRDLAVLYTPDDIGPGITMKKLGYPDSMLFLLHQDHPRLKMTVMGCPANRYIASAGTLPSDAEAAAVWKAFALDPAYDWIDMGGHGYTHSPDGDTNLDHHEFSTTQTGCNVNHAKLGSAAYCRRRMDLARGVFDALGIPGDLVTVMRFPGISDSPEALRAADRAGFVTIMGSRHAMEAGREWWVPFPGGEILEIQNSTMKFCFGRSEGLEKDLAEGAIAPESVRADPRFAQLVQRGRDYVDRVVEEGGILNLFDHYWETFQHFGDVSPRYLVMDAVLDDIESRYKEKVWYPSARDLGLWLDARRFSSVEWREADEGLSLTIHPPRSWKRLGISGLEQASLIARLPAGFTGVSSVEIRSIGGAFEPLASGKWWVGPDGVVINFPLRDALEILVRPEELPGNE